MPPGQRERVPRAEPTPALHELAAPAPAPVSIDGEASLSMRARPRRQPEVDVAHAVRAGGHQHDAGDPVAEPVRIELGQREDRHAAHRVPHQHDRARRRQLVDHQAQVFAEPVDGAVLAAGAPGSAVRALVVEHEPVLRTQREPLEVPAVEGKRETVDEHQGREPRRGLGLRLVDLGMERDPVRRHHGTALSAHGPQGSVCPGAPAGRPPPLGEDAGRRTRRGDTDAARRPARHSA